MSDDSTPSKLSLADKILTVAPALAACAPPVKPTRCACGSDRLLYEISYAPSVGVEDEGRQSYLCQSCGSRIWIDPPWHPGEVTP